MKMIETLKWKYVMIENPLDRILEVQNVIDDLHNTFFSL